jgi:hypothetical protein
VLPAGSLIADRFEVEALIGQGGMGDVYRARDRRDDRLVALKILREAHADTARFAAEIAVLADLAHPGIVGYVAHGATEDLRPFLVMEHLEGEDLAARLARRPLGASDALRLLEHVAAALAEAHRRGVVHRDLKPQNLFLRGGDLDRVTILDFGVARRSGAGRSLTATGDLVGTPWYMSPEQVQGVRDVGPPADVFALGCVLFECLTGSPPFSGDHLVASLAKILFEDPPPLAEICPDVPEPVRSLCARMLEKAPANRPRDADALAEALRQARASVGESFLASMSGLGRAELELCSVVIATHGKAGPGDTTLEARDAGAGEAAQREIAARGVSIERLADGSLVATLAQVGESAADQAAEAAACAQIIQARWPEAAIAVATARRVAGARLPLGEALDRAGALLPSATAARIVLDDVTAGLLQGRVRTERAGLGPATLHADRTPADATRPLLGLPTPCVGREQEIGVLEMTLSSCVDEGSARAVLVVSPAGLGKSRLRHELLRRAVAAPLRRLEGRAEPLRAASPGALVGRALRAFLGADGAPDPRAALLEGVARFLPADEARSAAEILGDLCDLPFPDDGRVSLRAARQDPRVMSARITDAVLGVLRGATDEGPLMVLLEDVHWADRRSLDLVGAALRELQDRPLFVAAFARPEIQEAYPGLWKGRVVELPLRPLGRRACERFVQRVAGDRLSAADAARIAEQSAGNALFLEELVRAACEGRSDGAPETVLAMLQARIGRLDPVLRRVLRAASVFAERFDAAAVAALLGPAERLADVEARLGALGREEILEAQREQPGEHRFRHALMREAAYGLLTDEDRRLGHRLAAAFLAARHEDPALIAEHHVRAGDPAAAAPWFGKAAQRAFDREDYAAVSRLVSRGRAAGAAGPALGELCALDAFCHLMRWSWERAGALAADAVALLPAGSLHWCYAHRALAAVAAFHDDRQNLRVAAERYLATTPHAPAVYADAAAHMASAAIQTGDTALGLALLDRGEQALGADLLGNPLVAAWLGIVRCTLLRHTDDDLAEQLRRLREALALYERYRASRAMLVLTRDVLGEVLCRAGALDEGERVLRVAGADAARAGVGFLVSHAQLALAGGLLSRGDEAANAEAEALGAAILATPGITAGYQAMARDVIAAALLRRGAWADAEREARVAIELSAHTPVRRWLMVARLAEALVRRGRHDEAHEHATRAVAEMDRAGAGGYATLPLLIAASRAAESAGVSDRARALRDRAEAWIERIARAFPDEPARALYARHARSEADR